MSQARLAASDAKVRRRVAVLLSAPRRSGPGVTKWVKSLGIVASPFARHESWNQESWTRAAVRSAASARGSVLAGHRIGIADDASARRPLVRSVN